MKFAWSWIGEHVDLSGISPDDAAAKLTGAGLAVERVERHGDETVLDVDLTTNRPDAMNHRGLARELAALTGRPLRPLAEPPPAAPLDAGLVTVDDAALCPRYASRLISGVKVGPSPAALAARLEAIGLRPINNVVDATNLVLWDLGHPLHAFDRDRLAGGRVVIRRARAGEKLVTLDGVDRALAPHHLVIADAEKPAAVAGVMGGEASGVTDATTNLLLESAWFDPASIRRTSKELGLHTDASHRFERGADFDAVVLALDAVAAKIVELAGGTLAPERADVVAAGGAPSPRRVTLRHRRIERIAGVPVDAGTVAPILAGLGLPATPVDGGWSVEVPPRRVDLEIEDDLVEEVLRLAGYDRIPAIDPGWPPTEGALSEAKRRENAVRESLLASGLDEVVTYSFVSADDQRLVEGEAGVAAAPTLENPLAETQGILRTTLLASLLPAAAHNVRHGRKEIAFFEVGRAFRLDGAAVDESRRAAFVLGGRWPRGAPGRRAPDFADAKGIVESVLERLGVLEATGWHPAAPGTLVDGTFAPGRVAEARWNGRVVALLGEVAPHVLHALDLGGTWVAAELVLGRVVGAGPGSGVREESFLPAPPSAFSFRPFSRYPAVELDLTLEHERSEPLAKLVAFLRELPDPVAGLLESVALRDRYDGKGVPDGKVRTTLSFVYRRADRSLTQDEVKEVHEGAVARLLERFGAKRS